MLLRASAPSSTGSIPLQTAGSKAVAVWWSQGTELSLLQVALHGGWQYVWRYSGWDRRGRFPGYSEVISSVRARIMASHENAFFYLLTYARRPELTEADAKAQLAAVVLPVTKRVRCGSQIDSDRGIVGLWDCAALQQPVQQRSSARCSALLAEFWLTARSSLAALRRVWLHIYVCCSVLCCAPFLSVSRLRHHLPLSPLSPLSVVCLYPSVIDQLITCRQTSAGSPATWRSPTRQTCRCSRSLASRRALARSRPSSASSSPS